MRGRVSKKKDPGHFARTAMKTKAVNLADINYRGGIRF